MNGRDEHHVALEQKIERMIEGKPDYLRLYYLSMQYPSMRTKSEYVGEVIHYLTYISDQLNVDISNPKNLNYQNVIEFLHSIQYKEKDGIQEPTSVAYRKLVWTCLNKFFVYLVSTHQIEENPMVSVMRPKGHDNVKRVYMKDYDIQAALQYISDYGGEFRTRDLAIVIVFLQTGMRVTALSEMDIENVSFQVVSSDGHIHSTADITGASITIVDKRNKEFEKLISATAAKYLYLWLVERNAMLLKKGIQNQSAVFINRDCQRISQHGINYLMWKYMPKIDGKQISPHALRRTYGTTLYQQTKDIYYVQQAMGHASPETTQMYVVESGNDKRRAADIMDSACFGIQKKER